MHFEGLIGDAMKPAKLEPLGLIRLISNHRLFLPVFLESHRGESGHSEAFFLNAGSRGTALIGRTDIPHEVTNCRDITLDSPSYA
jgi:hypothetical protein